MEGNPVNAVEEIIKLSEKLIARMEKDVTITDDKILFLTLAKGAVSAIKRQQWEIRILEKRVGELEFWRRRKLLKRRWYKFW